jgi:hypothetical protein
VTQEENDLKERQRLYERTRDELAGNARSISEHYDRALLTLSSAFLGGSLAFIGQVINLRIAILKWMLYGAWLFFALTIVLTLISFVYGLFTLQPLRDAAARFYLEKDSTAWKVSESVQRRILRFALACGVSFFAGILLLSGFIYFNLATEPTMAEKSSAREVQRSIPPGTFQKPVPAGPVSGGSDTAQTNPPAPVVPTPPQKQR